MKCQRKIIVFLVMVFCMPMIVAGFLLKHPQYLAKTTNYGTFVTADVFWLRPLSHHRPWTLVYWQVNSCDAACVATVERLAKLRLAMGRKLYATNIVLYLNATIPLNAQIQKQLLAQDIEVVYTEQFKVKNWYKTFPKSVIVLVNPENKALLWYSTHFESKKMYHDLQKLIK